MSENSHRGKPLFWWLIPNWKTVKRGSLIVSILLLVAYIGTHVWVYWWFNNNLSAHARSKTGRYTQIHQFFYSTLKYPEGWFDDREPSSEALCQELTEYHRIQKKLYTQSNFYTLASHVKQLYEGNSTKAPLTQQEIVQYKEDLTYFEPLIQIGKKITSIIQQEIVHQPHDCPTSYLPHRSWSTTILTPLHVKVRLSIENQKFDDALDDSMTILISNLPFEETNDFYYRFYQIAMDLLPIDSLIGEITDQERLRFSLDFLNHLKPHLFKEITPHIYTIQVLSQLRDMKNRGQQIDIQSGMKGIDAVRQIVDENYTKPSWRQNLAHLEYELLCGNKNDWSKISALIRNLIEPLLLTNRIEEYRLYRSFDFPDILFIKNNQDQVASRFDLIRLKIAAQLYALDTGQTVTATADLVPAYIPCEIKDRVSGLPYEWDQNGQIIAR